LPAEIDWRQWPGLELDIEDLPEIPRTIEDGGQFHSIDDVNIPFGDISL